MWTGIVIGGAIAWWLIKKPPKIVKWIMKNKVKSLIIVTAAYLGYSTLQKTISHTNHRDKVRKEFRNIQNEVRSRQKPEQTKKIKQKTPQQTPKETLMEKRYDEVFKKNKEKRMTEIAERRTTIEKMAFVSTPDKDMSARSGPRAMVAHERMQSFIKVRSKQSTRPDLSGMHTILIYQDQNPENHVVLHVGFHANTSDQKHPYRVYESQIKTKTGTMPMIGAFNIRFAEVPDIALGVSANENGAKLVNILPNTTTLDITKDQGRTALRVSSDGTLGFLTDPKEIEGVFSRVNLEQVVPLSSQGFMPYNTLNQYQYPAPTQATKTPIRASEGR